MNFLSLVANLIKKIMIKPDSVHALAGLAMTDFKR